MTGNGAADGKARVLAVSVGMPCTLAREPKLVTSGIVKRAVAGDVAVAELGLDGDGQADLSVHGGRDKAVYVYSAEHNSYWHDVTGQTPTPAAFGENLTVSGMTEDNVVIGARYRVGSALLRVAQPRLPCFKLGLLWGDATFPARFLASGRLGFYCRVETTGKVSAGATMELVDAPDKGFTVHELWRLVFAKPARSGDAELAERGLNEMPLLDAGWRRRLRARANGG